ncbi:MAG TPA: arsenite efflux transporter metallochaperone ArsD [Dermatophilaceae bacterium]|nr:arsenite efflux transporter metallochaperone ArsD [Dermatophilaceae bacterium]HOV02613.1 arsenite efflux transporter metallochaperone ArsD [Dermatophilaceae bacterium]HQG12258.1 arsenite efflux transporter metallochaperone ArsD [Dermatophilaceae bacterium]HQH91860.1 arsenite efflux transporter metallochaperone ArsD [Dermatophilaceae bacterium]HQK61860.1 arsenite efflux transporter metallochaperone ArsD [Dermatophilaceae bacterium]
MTTAPAPAIRVFEPALCCNTGVCGPDVDQALVTFTADLDHLRGLGVDIERHNLANDPAAFAAEPAVRDFLRVAGSAGLPLTLVDGVTVATGAYPTRDRLLSLAHRTDAVAEDAAVATQVLPTPVTQRVDLGLTAVTSSTAPASGGCCGGGASGGSGCC